MSYCKYCEKEVSHTSLMCFNKPRSSLRRISKKTQQKKIDTKIAWFEANPPNSDGGWVCYLRISQHCPVMLTRDTLELEHVKSKASHPHLRYEVSNLLPACRWCNELKGGLSLERVNEIYGRSLETE